MRNPLQRQLSLALLLALTVSGPSEAQGTRDTTTYRRFKAALDAIPAIDTHDHLMPFDRLPAVRETDRGKGVNLAGLWQNSYYTWNHRLEPWTPGMRFDAWWQKAKRDFDDSRAASFYRYQLPAFTDLYGVDFETLTDEAARALDDRIFTNYKDCAWLQKVVTERANIELMFNDPYWDRFGFSTDYPFGVLVLNVTTLVDGFHPSEFKEPADDPYAFAVREKMTIRSLDDYLKVLDLLFTKAKEKGAVCLKTTLAYKRTLRFEDVPAQRAAEVFGRPRSELSVEQVNRFEDFIMWRLVEMSARHGLPFQIHTGQARIQGSSPMLLVDLIEANPKTKFILFHGGFPWVGETGVILMRHGGHVWMPTLSYETAKRAFHEWLDVMPSSRIMWGADANHAEGIYGATEMTRRCLAEVLAERVDRGDLREEHALRIGRQILRDNALSLFPQLESRLWKHKKAAPAPPLPTSPTHAGDARNLNRNDVTRIDAMIHAYDRPGAPGISVIVVKGRTVLYKKAYGLADVEAGVPNTTITNFRLASVTKQFTAMAILILMERGKLSLESHVVDFFPDFPAYGREITIRQLLNHTSGLPDYAALMPADQKQQLSDEDVLRILKQATKGDSRPGSKFEYSNSGYVVLGLIAAKASGKSFARFLEESIFQPLGMSSTVAYEPGISTVKNRAYGYTPSGKTFRRTDQSLTSATLGDGGIYSSVEDLYYWDQALNTTTLVRATTLKQAFSPGNYGNGQTSNYGFGWFVDTVGGIRAASHGGGTVGFRNHIVRLPDEKLTVIVLMNRSDGVPAEIADNIARSYFPDFTGSPRLP